VIPIEQFFAGPRTRSSPTRGADRDPIPTPLARFRRLTPLERKVGTTPPSPPSRYLAADGTVEKAGLALTNVGPTPIHCTEAEAYLTGKKPDAATLSETAKLAAKAATPSADRRGSVEYKREMARVLAGRALKTAVNRAGGK
jgi:carbon-monoxide dehydrogenase medium subunit